MSNTSGSGSGGSSGGGTQTGNNNGSTQGSKLSDAEIRQREKEIYKDYGGTYEGFIDYKYKKNNGEISKERLRELNPNMALGTSTADDHGSGDLFH